MYSAAATSISSFELQGPAMMAGEYFKSACRSISSILSGSMMRRSSVRNINCDAYTLLSKDTSVSNVFTQSIEYEGISYDDLIKNLLVKDISKHFPFIKNRMHSLSEIQDGWDGDNAKSMSLISLMDMASFFSSVDKLPSEIGVFLGHEGEVIINWESSNNSIVDITFAGGYVCIDSNDEENELMLEEAIKTVADYI